MKTKKTKKIVKKIDSASKKVTKEKKITYGSHTLIICEKPQASQKIAIALSNGTEELIKDKNGVAYYEFSLDGKRIVVGCAVGHLFGIKQNEARGEFPNFDVSWKANYESKGSEYTKKYYDVLKKLSKEASEIIVATDYDVEGEVIGWNVVRFICNRQSAKRMKFSSLTKDELLASWDNLEPTINWGEAYAGETRHYLDWFYGINLSRGLMKALSSTGKFRILSIGRVQGPALKMIYDQELEIRNFKPVPFWQVFLNVKDLNRQKLEVKHPKDIFNEAELLKFKHLKGQKGTAKTEISEEKIAPPVPFDLTTLQTESYRFHGLTPTQTLAIAQKLYLDGLISYPRTSSQKYATGINFEKILTSLKKYTQLTKYAVNKIPTEGPKTDPAHPAIYPTGEQKKDMPEQDRKVYDLIVKRFLACFCEPALVENKKVAVDVNGLNFSAKGMQIKEKNWINVYPNSYKEEDVVTMNGEVSVEEIRLEEKMTKPPSRYSAASLVKELERRELGTKATRASIVETLYTRGYIQEKSIEISPLGEKIITTLKKYSPVIIDEELTRSFEKEMEEITGAKSDFEKKEKNILEKSKVTIREIAGTITKNLEKIGKELADANEELYEQQRLENILGVCPKCNKGSLRIMFGRKFKRFFVSCDAYPACKTTFSLPPNGLIKPSKVKDKIKDVEVQEICPACNFPMCISLKKGSRPWKFCFNPECPTRKEREAKKAEAEKNIAKKSAEVKEENPEEN